MIAYITGASSGLGAYTAQALADNGWTVVAGARSFTGETDGRMTRLPLDVTRDDSVRDFMERAKQIGAPDAVIHCAAVLCFGSCEETTLADYARVMETNFLGMVRVNQQVLPLMREKGGGKVVLFSSINGMMGLPFQSAYTASKHAVMGLTRVLASEWGCYGITVNALAPGWIKTNLSAALVADPERYHSVKARIPQGDWGTPDVFKGVAVLLASEAGRYINGATIPVDGGYLTK